MQSSQNGMGIQPSFNGGPGLRSSLQTQVTSQHNVNRTTSLSQVPLGHNAGGVASRPAVLPSNQNQSASSNQLNAASVCRYGQETVQEIVSRAQEVFQILRMLMPPNGTRNAANLSNDRLVRTHDQIKSIKLLFKRLRYVYDKCNDSGQLQGMEYMHMEGLIPFEEERDVKSEERKTGETYRQASDEVKQLSVQLSNKNKHLKDIIDHLRRIIWELNTMLAMRTS